MATFKRAASPKKPKEKVLHKEAEAPKMETRMVLQKNEPNSKVTLHQKNPKSVDLPRKRARYKQQNMITDLAGSSVNPTINDVHKPKEEHSKEQMMTVAEL